MSAPTIKSENPCPECGGHKWYQFYDDGDDYQVCSREECSVCLVDAESYDDFVDYCCENGGDLCASCLTFFTP